MNNVILICTIIIQALVQQAKMHTVTVFEDGSFGLGYYPYAIEGCLPFSLCGNAEIIIHDDRMDIILGGD
jgi:hypothetical protein